MELLFITRVYPPVVGGMQAFASNFYKHYRELGRIDLLANRGGRRTLAPFALRTLCFIVVRARNYDVVHLSDAALSPLIPLIRLFSRARVSLTVHGLDVVYAGFGYQKFIPFFLRQADRVIANSRYTKSQCESRGVSNHRLRVIPMGIDIDELQLYPLQTKTEAVSGFGINLEGKKVLLTVGRLIRRKGHAWFVRSVLKKLPHHYVYLMAGSGPEAAAISKLVGALGLTDRAYLLGSVSDQVRNCLYQIADLLIMPNVHVKNDEEGFGMVALEAGRYGLPVIAANIEGIRDAVIDGETGRLINEQDDEGFLDAILTTHIERTTLMRIAAARFGWTSIVQRYYAEFEEMRQGKS